jgi:hypothetical protein
MLFLGNQYEEGVYFRLAALAGSDKSSIKTLSKKLYSVTWKGTFSYKLYEIRKIGNLVTHMEHKQSVLDILTENSCKRNVRM